MKTVYLALLLVSTIAAAFIRSTSDIPAGGIVVRIVERSLVNRYVRLLPNQKLFSSPIRAKANLFLLEIDALQRVTLKDVITNHYVSAHDTGRKSLRATRPEARTWERFTASEIAPEQFNLISKANSIAVAVQLQQTLIANAADGGNIPASVFSFQTVCDQDSDCLNGKYCDTDGRTFMCLDPSANETPCTRDTMCSSGTCYNDVCDALCARAGNQLNCGSRSYTVTDTYIDHVGDDLASASGSSVSSIARLCRDTAGCKGFNSDGWVKSSISPTASSTTPVQLYMYNDPTTCNNADSYTSLGDSMSWQNTKTFQMNVANRDSLSQKITTASCRCELRLQDDGNLVLYDNGSPKWSPFRGSLPRNYPLRLTSQADSNFCHYGKNNGADVKNWCVNSFVRPVNNAYSTRIVDAGPKGCQLYTTDDSTGQILDKIYGTF